MASRKPKAVKATTEAAVKSARATKSTSKKPASTTGSKAPSTSSTAPYRVKRYKSGILNLENTPTHLVPIAKHNAASSPLLRLPPEIRNQIWGLAMGGLLVRLPERTNKKGSAVVMIETEITNWGDRISVVPAAFHLPEVCRQIYSETVLTSYRCNVFFIASEDTLLSTWSTRLLSAQRMAVTRVQIGRWALSTYLRKDRSASNMSIASEKSIRSKLPSLMTILISYDSMKRTHRAFVGDAQYQLRASEDETWWKERIVKNFQDREGSDIEIKFV